MRSLIFSPVVFYFYSLVCIAPLTGDDWPQWMGPTRDGVYREAGVLEKFPADGLKIRWRQSIAGGYAGPAVARGKVLVPDFLRESGDASNDPGTRAQSKGKERLWCLDAATGKVLWKDEYLCQYAVSYPAGPRCTPTVDGDLVYTLGVQGDLRCIELSSGKLRWEKNLSKEFNSPVPIWGHSAHPLIDGPRLVCMVGGKNQAVVALDKLTGNELWRSLTSTETSYAPPVIRETKGSRQLIVFHPEGVAGLEPVSGKSVWSVDLAPQYKMSIARPQFEGDMFYASGIGGMSVFAQLSPDASQVKELWRGEQKNSVYSANATPLIHQGVIYGTDCQVGSLMAIDTKDGNRLWQNYDATLLGNNRRLSHGTAFLVRRNDLFWIFAESGDLILAKLSRAGYQELGRTKVLKPTGECFGRSVVWSHPAFANRTAYCRNDEEIVAVALE